MPNRLIIPVVAATMAATIGLGFTGSAFAASGNDDPPITIGWTAWADAEFVTKLAQQLIETRTDHEVALQMAAIGIQYQGVANGDLDAMMMAWLPDSQADYWQRFKDQVDDLGTIYDGARLGWVVPDYIPQDQLASISDLHKAEIREKLDGRIQGIDPGAGIMQLSKKTLDAYDLNDGYQVISASGAAMTAALKRALEERQWIVVTGWSPHWMLGKWNLRFLEDPKNTLGKPQHINVLAHRGFADDYPQVAAMLEKMVIPLEELQKAMYDAQDTSTQAAVKRYIANHAERVDGWFGAEAP